MNSKRNFIAFTLALLPTLAFAQGFVPNELVVEGLVDGPSSFHLRPEGVYWVNGANAKPGKHEGHDEPTYINGVAWMPHWSHSKQERGADKSEIYRIDFGTTDVDYELLAVTQERGATGIEHRTEVATKHEGNEFVVTIPDPESGHRWYKFVLRKKVKKP